MKQTLCIFYVPTNTFAMQALSTLFAPKRFANLKWLFQAVGAGRGAVRQIDVESWEVFQGTEKDHWGEELVFLMVLQISTPIKGNPCSIIVGSDAAPKMWFFLEMSIWFCDWGGIYFHSLYISCKVVVEYMIAWFPFKMDLYLWEMHWQI